MTYYCFPVCTLLFFCFCRERVSLSICLTWLVRLKQGRAWSQRSSRNSFRCDLHSQSRVTKWTFLYLTVPCKNIYILDCFTSSYDKLDSKSNQMVTDDYLKPDLNFIMIIWSSVTCIFKWSFNGFHGEYTCIAFYLFLNLFYLSAILSPCLYRIKPFN